MVTKFTCYHGRYSPVSTPSLAQIYESIDRYSLQAFEGGLPLDDDPISFQQLVRDVYALQYSIHDLLHAAGDLVYKFMSNIGYHELRQLVPADLYKDFVRDRREVARNDDAGDGFLDGHEYSNNEVEGFFIDPGCIKTFVARPSHHMWPHGTDEKFRIDLIKTVDSYTPLYYKRNPANLESQDASVKSAQFDAAITDAPVPAVSLVTGPVLVDEQPGVFVKCEIPGKHRISEIPFCEPQIHENPTRVGQKALGALACARVPPDRLERALMLGSGHGAMTQAIESKGIHVVNLDLRGEDCFHVDLLKAGRAFLVTVLPDGGIARHYPDHTVPECKEFPCLKCVDRCANPEVSPPRQLDDGIDLVFSDLSHDKNLNDRHLWTARNDRLYMMAAATALMNLRPGGVFVLKVTQFMSPNLAELVDRVQRFFSYVEMIKPTASRWLNGEFFLVFSRFSVWQDGTGSFHHLSLAKALLRHVWALPGKHSHVTAKTGSGLGLTFVALRVQRERLLFAVQYLYSSLYPSVYVRDCSMVKYHKQDHSLCRATLPRSKAWLQFVRERDAKVPVLWINEAARRYASLQTQSLRGLFVEYESVPYRV